MKIFKKLTDKKFRSFIKDGVAEGSVFLHYTGNMFGIGCSAFDEKAVNRINDLKKRTQEKGYIVLIPEVDWLERYGIKYYPKIRRLFQQYWPGELSVILDDPENNFKFVSQDQKVAFRIPTSSFLREFIKKIDKPIISTSINLSGEVPYENVEDILQEKSNWFDFAVIPPKYEELSTIPSTVIDGTKENIECAREGKIPFSEIQDSYIKPLILFICTANICRSPMAEYYLKHLVEKSDLSYRIGSAGFFDSGIRISENSRIVLDENNIDASQHISTQINEQLIRDSWLVLTMTTQHKLYLLDSFPNSINKVFTLSEFTSFNMDIDDPYGLDIYFYRETFKKIKDRIENFYNMLLKEEK